jgi:hypothetical protein
MSDDAQRTPPKLTEPQRTLLRTAASSKPSGLPVATYYPPVKRLVALGLVTLHEQRYGGHKIVLTDAGWEATRG